MYSHGNRSKNPKVLKILSVTFLMEKFVQHGGTEADRSPRAVSFFRGVVHSLLNARHSVKNRQSRTTCSYFCSREIKNRNGLACNPDKTEEDHLCSCFQSITLPGID